MRAKQTNPGDRTRRPTFVNEDRNRRLREDVARTKAAEEAALGARNDPRKPHGQD
jgi:hypothetical protein